MLCAQSDKRLYDERSGPMQEEVRAAYEEKSNGSDPFRARHFKRSQVRNFLGLPVTLPRRASAGATA